MRGGGREAGGPTGGPPPVDCMIVGAQKAGTTSLLRYLASHPRVLAHPHKELGYFLDEGEHRMGWEAAWRRYFGHDRWSPERRVVGKSAGLLASAEGLERLRDHNPACQVVVLLRDPVERFRSSWRWEAAHGGEARSLEEVVDAVLGPGAAQADSSGARIYLRQGEYARHLHTLLELFPGEQVGVHLTEELAADPESVVEAVLASVGLEPSAEVDLSARHNETRQVARPGIMRLVQTLAGPRDSLLGWLKDRLPQRLVVGVKERLEGLSRGEADPSRVEGRVRERLLEHYEPEIRKLESLLGRELDRWREAPGGEGSER